jgi:uncharacterized protein (DUF1800 family)
VTDDVTPEMVHPVIEAWTKSDGDLPTIYKALIRVVYAHTGNAQEIPQSGSLVPSEREGRRRQLAANAGRDAV